MITLKIELKETDLLHDKVLRALSGPLSGEADFDRDLGFGGLSHDPPEAAEREDLEKRLSSHALHFQP